MMNTPTVLSFEELVACLDGNNAAKFATITYRAKTSGELARYTVIFNVNRTNALKRDLAFLKSHRPSLSGIDAMACDELIASITETLETGSNSLYTKKGYYAAEGNGNVQVSIRDKAYVRGYVIRKDVIEKGEYKAVKSAPKTVAKNKLRKKLKNTRIREFIIDTENFVCARTDGKAIILDATGSNLNKLANTPPITLAVPVAA